MSRIDLTPTETGFTLARDGETLAVLTDDDVLAFANAVENFRQTIMTRLPHNAVYATPVTTTQVRSDALGEKTLIQFCTEPNGRTVFQLDYSQMEELIRQIRNVEFPTPRTQTQQ